MSLDSLSSSAPVSRLQAPKVAAAPTVAAPSQASDAAVFSPKARAAAGEAEAEAWSKDAFKRIKAGNEADLNGIVAEAEGRLKQGGGSKAAEGLAHLVLSGASGRLAELGVSAMSNGKKAFAELQTAFATAPGRNEVTSSYARTIGTFTEMNRFIRFFVEMGLGIKVGQEAGRLVPALMAFPDDARAQLLAERLASFNDDDDALGKIRSRLAELEKKDPGALAKARQELQSDADRSNALANKAKESGALK